MKLKLKSYDGSESIVTKIEISDTGEIGAVSTANGLTTDGYNVHPTPPVDGQFQLIAE
jgi:hypothetical protein